MNVQVEVDRKDVVGAYRKNKFGAYSRNVVVRRAQCMQESGVSTDKSGKGLFETSSRVAGVVLGDIVWKKPEERREGMKTVVWHEFGRDEESPLVKMVMEKLRLDRGIGWCKE